MHTLPHLFKSRHGVFYLRLARGGQEVKRSLRMKDFRQARLLALAFNLELAMKTPDDKPKVADFNLDTESLKRLCCAAKGIRGRLPHFQRSDCEPGKTG